MSQATIVQIADYSAAFSSNFVSSLLALARTVRRDLGLSSIFVFPERARGRSWVAAIQDEGITIRFTERDVSHRQRVRDLMRLAEETRPALFHTHFGTFDVDAAYAASRTGCGTIWHMHSPYPRHDTLRKRVGERLKFQLVARMYVDRIVAVAPSVAESAVEHGGPPSKCVVVLNGIDLERVQPLTNQAKTSLRQRYGIPTDDFVFLLFGWDPLRKGVDLFADAIRLVPRPSQGVVRGLVVRGERNEAEVRASVRDAPDIQIVGPVPDVADLYGLADCFVSASRSEGVPYAIGEAMGADLPVITSDLPQVVAVYRPAGDGFQAFRTGDARDLAATMTRVLNLRVDERRRLGRANRAYVQDRLSVDHWSQNIVRLYRSVLGFRGRSFPGAAR